MGAILSIEWLQPEDVDGPRERDLELCELGRPHPRRAGRWWESCDRREEPADDRRQIAGVGHQLGWRRPAFEAHARQPEGEVDTRVADARPVPVDELRA